MHPFLEAAQTGDLKKLKSLFAAKLMANLINLVDKTTGKSALHFASEKGHLKVVKWLILKGADINLCDHAGWSPIFFAAEQGHFEVTEFLFTKKPILIFLKSQDDSKSQDESKLEYITPMATFIQNQTSLYLRVHALTAVQKLSEKHIPLLQRLQSYDKIYTLLKDAIQAQGVKESERVSATGLHFTEQGLIVLYANAAKAFLDNKDLLKSGQLHGLNLDSGQEILLMNKGKVPKNLDLKDFDKKPFKLPPQVLLVEFQDPAYVTVITSQLKFLKELGYSKILFEFDNRLTLPYAIKKCSEGIERFSVIAKDKKATKEAQKNAKKNLNVLFIQKEFLSNMQSSGLEYCGIDKDFVSRSEKLEEKLLSDNAFNDERYETLAKHMICETEKASGGTITVMCFLNVGGVQQKLQQHNARFLKFYQYYQCLSDKVAIKTDFFDQVRSLHNHHCTLFPIHYIDLRTNKEETKEVTKEKALAKYRETLQNSIGVFNALKEKPKKETKVEQSKNEREKATDNLKFAEYLMQLEEFFNMPFLVTGDIVTGIDALLPVDLSNKGEATPQFKQKFETIKTRLGLQKSNTLKKPLTFCLTEENQIMLVIPSINKDNQSVLKKAIAKE